MARSKKFTVELTLAELDQLVSYCQHWELGADWGWYFGNKEQWYARHDRIRLALARASEPQSDIKAD